MKTPIYRHPALYAVLFVVFTWTLFGYFIRHRDYQVMGQWGDSFGYINSLFTGLALAGIVATYWRDQKASADREAEQREILRRMDAQITATHQYTGMVRKATRVTVLRERIQRLQQFLDEEATKPQGNGWVQQRQHELGIDIKKLEDECDQLTGTPEEVPQQSGS